MYFEHHWLLVGILLVCEPVVARECMSCVHQPCRKVMGIFSKASLPVGYNMIARIPPQSCNLTVTEVVPSTNFLALRTKNGYIINGNWAVLPQGRYMGAGTGFIYSHSTPENGETIYTPGPVGEFVDVMVIYHSFNPGISYEYWHPIMSSSRPIVSFPGHGQGRSVPRPGSLRIPPHNQGRKRRPNRRGNRRHPGRGRFNRGRQRKKFLQVVKPSFITNPVTGEYVPGMGAPSWTVWKFTACTRTCGGGQQKTVYICTGFDGQVLDDSLCSQPKPLPRTVECNTKPCPPTWGLDDWSPCSVTCGTGQRTRNWNCIQQVSATATRTLPASLCPSTNPGSRTPTTQLCTMAPCTRWEVTPWTKCSVECGTGFRSREVICQAEGVNLPQSQCNRQEQPPTKELCHGLHCSQNTWFFTDWTDECIGGCETGFHTRRVWCAPSINSIRGRCPLSNRPPDQKPCTNLLTCAAAWFTGPWSPCSNECGNGTRSREVVCVIYLKGTFRATLDIECDGGKRPLSAESCNTEDCLPQWYYTEWSECSRMCDRGRQNRAVQCLDGGQRPSLECSLQIRPDTNRICNTQSCSKSTDSSCMDQYPNCDFVLRARLCRYSYYKSICCASCAHNNVHL